MRNRKAGLVLLSCILALTIMLGMGLKTAETDIVSAGQLIITCCSASGEASEPVGKVAVGVVVMNRVESSLPSTIPVIYQKWAFTSVCQINIELIRIIELPVMQCRLGPQAVLVFL